jgi:hypothetical protein
MKRLTELRPFSVFCLMIVLAGCVYAAVRSDWVTFTVIVIGCPAVAYLTRHEARWFR